MNAKILLEWGRKHDAENQSIKGFWESFRVEVLINAGTSKRD
ncbi:hypothetical protein [Lysinibacillus sp. NPDC092081]